MSQLATREHAVVSDVELHSAATARVTDWLSTYSIADRPAGTHVSNVTLRTPDGTQFCTLFDNEHCEPLHRGPNRPRLAVAMCDEPFHTQWNDIAEHFVTLQGPFVHPDHLHEADGYLLATSRSALLVGCVDRSDPDLPRRFNPTLSPFTDDIGVIAYPVPGAGVIASMIEDGFDAYGAAVVLTVATLCEFAIHETLELHQHTYGIPVFDPHQESWLTASVTFATSRGAHTVELRP